MPPEDEIQRLKFINEKCVEDIKDLKEINRKLDTELNVLNDKFDTYISQKQQEEAQRLRSALIWAGGLIIALGGFMWSEVIWPLIKGGVGN